MKKSKVQYASDLHLEFDENLKFLAQNPIEPRAEMLILAGDIVPLKRVRDYDHFFDRLSEEFQEVYWIPGNHEYYHYDLAGCSGAFKEQIRENIWLVNNQEILYQEYRFLFSTLWSRISPQNELSVSRGMNDFRLIRNHGELLTPMDINELHRNNLDFLETSLQKGVGLKTVVVTHHVPTFKNYPRQYLNSVLNEAFAVELEGLILDYEPSYWIYGHHHSNTPDFQVGNTRLLTNQLGYVALREHSDFDPGCMI